MKKTALKKIFLNFEEKIALFVQFLGAQEVNLRFESDIWDFGQIAEDGGKVEYLFKFGNNADKPIVILDIKSGCGCTTPVWVSQFSWELPLKVVWFSVTFFEMLCKEVYLSRKETY